MALSAAEISRLAGFKKPWMLNHLEREKIFLPENPQPAKHGKYRKYTFRDLVVLRAINRMLELGARPKRIMESIATFSRVLEIPPEEDELIRFANSMGSFVVTKEEVFYCRSNEEIIGLITKGQMSFSFMVDIKTTLEPVIASLAEYRKSSGGSAQHRRDRLDKIANSRDL